MTRLALFLHFKAARIAGRWSILLTFKYTLAAEDLRCVEAVDQSICDSLTIYGAISDSRTDCKGRQCSKSNSVRLKTLVPLRKRWWTRFVNL
jgi:hypothetical protein